jgi:hypothetical protein
MLKKEAVLKLPTRACVPTVAPLVAQEFLTTRPSFFMRNAEGTETRNSVSSILKNKGATVGTQARVRDGNTIGCLLYQCLTQKRQRKIK